MDFVNTAKELLILLVFFLEFVLLKHIIISNLFQCLNFLVHLTEIQIYLHLLINWHLVPLSLQLLDESVPIRYEVPKA